ncbi:unnamed protein product [Notodromas monacha]|uniref:Uncharacterized protein n=1 Tax=Notodromas monacha TaxID=399045 RepID=A0A7R9BWH2_9CRUS|nr:unnamed protein product [Notodromas monacha]CAG0921926.1 unnamed protein product [Notodromas monacha]
MLVTMKFLIALFALVCFTAMMLESTNASPIQDSAESKDICCFGCVNCKTELNKTKDICCDVCYICKDHEGVIQSDGSNMIIMKIYIASTLILVAIFASSESKNVNLPAAKCLGCIDEFCPTTKSCFQACEIGNWDACFSCLSSTCEICDPMCYQQVDYHDDDRTCPDWCMDLGECICCAICG